MVCDFLLIRVALARDDAISQVGGSNMAQERRRRRSVDPRKALTYQLAHVQHEACLEALVLADKNGLVVAGAGDDELVESLAALAPLMSHGAVPCAHDLPASYVQVRVVNLEGSKMYLASCTESFADTLSGNMEAWLEHTQAGVQRILAA